MPRAADPRRVIGIVLTRCRQLTAFAPLKGGHQIPVVIIVLQCRGLDQLRLVAQTIGPLSGAFSTRD